MSQIACARRGFAFVPIDDDGIDALRKLSEGQECLIEIKAKRNIARHRLAWKLASLIHENADLFPSRECAMDAIKIGTGHLEIWIEPITGVVHERPKSIAFHLMEEIDFAQFLDRAVTLICGRWLVGTEDRALLSKVNECLDYRGSTERRAA